VSKRKLEILLMLSEERKPEENRCGSGSEVDA
jgi:hypothetical protein